MAILLDRGDDGSDPIASPDLDDEVLEADSV
jgi:hypothetical protein